MKSFKEYIGEAAKTQKQFIAHLDKMPPLKFLELAKRLDKEMGGVLSKDNVEIREKMDGSALRIGLDEKGRFFAQTSTSPSFFNFGDFRKRFSKHGEQAALMGDKWDQIFKMIKSDSKVKAILKKYNTENGIKIVGEIMYPPLGIDLIDKMRFIRIDYEKKKLGSDYTFVPFYVMDNENNVHPQEKEIFKELYKISNSKRKYVNTVVLKDREIDIKTDLSIVNNDLVKKYKNLNDVLVSRKHIDRELKTKIKDEILILQRKLAQKILSYVEGGLLGKDFEGIVIKLSDGSLIKIISDKFKTTTFDKNR